jgi:hypothetical protein
MICITLDHVKGCFDCTLRNLVAEITGLPANLVPRHWVYNCREPQLAIAVTTRNAVEIRQRVELGLAIMRKDPPWHVQYNGNHRQLRRVLEAEGYFERN